MPLIVALYDTRRKQLPCYKPQDKLYIQEPRGHSPDGSVGKDGCEVLEVDDREMYMYNAVENVSQ